MPKYLSGRVKRRNQAYLSTDRYQFLGLDQAEPNLGDSPGLNGSLDIPAGQQYQIVSLIERPGERFWVPIGGGVIPGSISVFDEGSIVGTLNSITQLNFVGSAITASSTDVRETTITLKNSETFSFTKSLLVTQNSSSASGIVKFATTNSGIVTLTNVVGTFDGTGVLKQDNIAIGQTPTDAGTVEEIIGVGVTIKVAPDGNENEVLFVGSDDFNTDTRFSFVDGLLNTGDKITVGIGGTVITTTDTGKVGIGSTTPIAKLDMNVGSAFTAVNVTGTEGQLLLITDDITSGSIFAVNDVSGMPSIDVDATGTIQLAPFGENEFVGIGTTNPTSKLHVIGDTNLADNLNVSGISTFQNKVHLLDNDVAHFGGSLGEVGDLLIFANGSTNAIDARNADLTITNNLGGGSFDIKIQAKNGENSAIFNPEGSVDLYFDDTKRFSTSGIGATVFGQLDTTNLSVSGVSTFSDDIFIGVGATVGFGTTAYFSKGSTGIRFDQGGGVVAWDHGPTHGTNITSMGYVLDGGILGSYWDDIFWVLDQSKRFQIGSSGIIQLGSESGAGAWLQADSNSTRLYHSASYLDLPAGLKLETSGIGVTVYGRVDTDSVLVSGTTTTRDFKTTGVSTFTGNIVPATNESADIGESESLRFNRIYAREIFGEINTVQDNQEIGKLQVNGISTFIGLSTFANGIEVVSGTATFNGNIDANANLDVDGTTTLDNTTIDGLLDINAGGQANTFKVEDLTEDRVVIVGTGGELEDSANLTFNGSTLSVGVDLDVDGHTELDDLNVSGFSTFVGNAEFKGNVSIAGTLTYEDVTNVDSIGIITARKDVHVGAGLSVVGITSSTSFESTVTTENGAPFVVASTTKVVNLNADLLDDKSTANGAAPNTVVVRNAAAGFSAADVTFEDIVGTALSISGISTFAGITTVTGSDLFTKRLNVAGVSTFHARIDALTRIDVGTTGTAGQIKISNGTSDVFTVGSIDGNLTLRSANGAVQADDNIGRKLFFGSPGGAFQIYHAGGSKLSTTGYGVTVKGNTETRTLNVTGLSTFADDIDANGALDVDGHTNLDNVNVAGVTTFATDVKLSATEGQIEATGSTGLTLNASDNSAFARIRVAGNTRLHIASTGNVGIGTTIAPHLLSVKGTISKISSTSGIQLVNIANDGSQNGTIVINNSSGVEKVKLNSAGDSYFNGGNVGIATDSPTTKLDVREGSILVDAFNTSGDHGIFFRRGFITGTNLYNLSILAYDHSGANKDGLSINAYDGISFCTGSNTRNEQVRITQAGNVGIGTDDPASPLHIHDSGPGIRLSDSGNVGDNNPNPSPYAFAYFDANAANAIIHADKGNDVANSRVAFAVDNSEKMRIEADGKVGIGTDSPDAPLHILSDANNMVQIESTDRHSTLYLIDTIGSSFIQNDSGELRFGVGGGASAAGGETEAVRIDSNGLVGIGTAANLGDARLTAEGVTTLTNTDQTVMVRDSNADDAIGRGGNIGFGAYVDGTMRTLAAIGGLKKNSGNAFDGNLALYTRRNAQATLDQRLTILSTGEVGINDTNPSSTLTVAGDVSLTRGTTTSTLTRTLSIGGARNQGNHFASIDLKNYDSDSSPLVDYVAARITGTVPSAPTNGGELVFYTTPTGGDPTGITVQERLRITAGGNIGIGTDNPQSALDVAHESGTNPLLYLRHSSHDVEGEVIRIARTDNPIIRYHSIKAMHGGAVTNNYITFNLHDGSGSPHTQQEEVLRLIGNGRVGIGTNDPKAKLHVENVIGTATTVIISQQKTYGVGSGTAERAMLDLALREASQTADNRVFGRMEAGTNSETTSQHGFLAFSVRQGGSVSEKLRITSTGVLEIERGSAKDQAIDIKTTATTGASRIRFVESGTSEGELAYSHNNNQLELVARSGNQIAMFTNGTSEKLRINLDGDLLRGGTGQDIGSASEPWDKVYANEFIGLINTTQENVTTGNLLVTGIATFQGNVSIAGTLTYEDVTNIDSIGIITARTDVHVGAGLSVVGISTFNSVINANNGINLTDSDNKSILLGEHEDMRIRHTGSNSEITDEGTGSLRLGGDQIVIGNAGFTENNAVIKQGAAGYVVLKQNGIIRLQTTNSGVDITDNLHVAGITTALGMVDIANSSGANLTLRNSSEIANDEDIANINIVANDGPSDPSTGAQIKFQANNTWTANRCLTDIIFKHANTASPTTLVDALRISAAPSNTSTHVSIGHSSASNTSNYYFTIKGYERSSQGASGDTVNLGIFNQSQSASATANIDFRLGQAALSNTVAARLLAGKENNWTNTASTRDGYFAISLPQDAQITERFRIRSNGKVGIGTDDPESLLSLYSDASGDELLHFDMGSVADRRGWKFEQKDDGPATKLNLRSDANGKSFLISDSSDNVTFQVNTSSTGGIAHNGAYVQINSLVSIAQTLAHTGDTDTKLEFPADNTIKFDTAGTERLRITSTGLVGINSTSPAAKLDVVARGDTEAGIRLLDSNVNQSAPYIEVIGKRSDGNTSQGFAGKIHLAKNFTGNKINNGSMLGAVVFGGNHTDGTEANILYTASISAVSSDSFDSATDMPTDLVFLTGSTGKTPTAVNTTTGTERLRITSDGFVGINEPLAVNGLTINKSGDYSHFDTNTYYQPVGKWLSAWGQADLDDGEDHWVGFTGKYGNTSASVNISLAPNYNNTSQQAGMYVAAEAISATTSDFTVGKIVSGSSTGQGTSGNVRATKSELFRIAQTGNVGIGTDDPYYKLQVNFDNANTSLSGGSSGNWGGNGIRIENDNTTVGAMSLAHFRVYDADWHIGNKYVSSNTSDFVFNHEGSEITRITNAGNLLVGHDEALLTTTTHRFRFQVTGTDFATSGVNQIRFQNDTPGATLALAHSRNGTVGSQTILQNNDEFGKIRFYGSDGNDFDNFGAEIRALVDGTPGNNVMPGRIEFETTAAGESQPTPRMRIGSDGKIRLGGNADTAAAYTLDFGKSTASTIRLIGESNGTAIRMGAGGSGNDFTLIRVDGATDGHDGESDNSKFGYSLKYMGSRTGNNNSFSLFADDSEGTQFEAITVLQDGKIGIKDSTPSYELEVNGTVAATNFDSLSDRRHKTNIQVIENPIEKIKKIDGVSFNWKKTNEPSLGVIADNVLEVLPEIVSGEDTKSVNYNGLIGVLIEVVKDQQKQIDELRGLLDK